MTNILIIKALLSAWNTLGFYVVHAGMSDATIAASYWYGAKNVFFHVDFRFGAPRYMVNFNYWDSEHNSIYQCDYDTKNLHKALKKAYMFQNHIKALETKN